MAQSPPRPRVLIFPLPLQGPVNSMLKLSELLCLGGLHVTFLVTDHIDARLRRYSNVQSRFHSYPGFRLQAISDGLPENHPRGDKFLEVFESMKVHTKPLFKELLQSGGGGEGGDRISCVIADGGLEFPLDVAEEVGIPLFIVRTISAACLWVFFCLPQLIQSGELPFTGDDDLDVMVKSVPGMERYLRRRDLPSFCRSGNPPLHAHLKAKLAATGASLPDFSNSLWEEDRFCLVWLDDQPPKSVLYVSFGSLATVTRDQLMEFWHGLVNSGQRFLWVIRQDSVAGESQVPMELLQGSEERGFVVYWAPQEEVLAHPAVGGFLTHSGWNSTLESAYEGVPMICWPYFLDQQVNSRLVEEEWKLGFDMKDTCDRSVIEKTVRNLMEVRKDEFQRSAAQMASSAKTSLGDGGSSFSHLERLIQDIKDKSVV
ncbi:hypothetical protein SASPL_145982 [Salvia splendens]|uniref:Glycosyltransferase n=1 Tax=Salvia splendens TaxID=180675 RepID=A0A8X8Z8V4_SALSN|nr:hypothetical protein SASPL_145982 [Salvia splendens]